MMEQTNEEPGSTSPAAKTYTGACHCGRVRFEADVDLGAPVSRCNCSVCTKIPNVTSIVKPTAFRLLAGEGDLGQYAWGGKTGTRFFCKHCGVHCFLRGSLAELGGPYVSVTVNALDGVDPATLKVVHWDGRHDSWHAGPRETPWPISDAPPS